MEDLINPEACQWLRTCLTEAFHPSAISGGFLSNAGKMMEREAQPRRRALAESIFSDTSHATTHQDYCLPAKICNQARLRGASNSPHNQIIYMKERTNGTKTYNIPLVSHAFLTLSSLMKNEKQLPCVYGDGVDNNRLTWSAQSTRGDWNRRRCVKVKARWARSLLLCSGWRSASLSGEPSW